ncbi:hypothetical protein Ahy_B08g091149 isoform C [Arachis hypogaea]|uniref:Uncharacterized protein n=1 Tax=Arachis hypogaea TaxID=3818 RepID=A0A444Y1I2_ARAHY|nr:hypothetical protein Ahy_B08g091149 isoform C [Arachis hypogaea]
MFEPLKPYEMSDGQFRKVSVPQHRYNPLKKALLDIYTPIYEQMKIDIRMNLKARKVELKMRPDTPDISNLQKCADFVHMSSMLSPSKSRMLRHFEVITCLALLEDYLVKAVKLSLQLKMQLRRGL